MKRCKLPKANLYKFCCHRKAAVRGALSESARLSLVYHLVRLTLLALLPSALCLAPSRMLAQSTPAGTIIENNATGTFEDPNTGEVKQVISNSVIVTVAEVAGITVTAAGLTEVDGSGDIDAGDSLYFDFTVTNVGNDPTRFRIPNAAAIAGAGTISGRLQISIDGGKTWIDIASTSTSPGFTFTDDYVETGSFAPGESIRVRVPVTVSQTAVEGDALTVQLGQTPNNAQNVQQIAEPRDVFTVDNPDGVAGESPGVPANGVREASAIQRIAIGIPPLALATISKTYAQPINAGNPADPSDDTITYNLALEVRSQTPPGSSGFVAGDLTGSSINVNGNPVTRILISDAIPVGTELIGNATPPTGWQLVYTKDDPATVNANSAQWYTNPNDAVIGGLANVTRIGFIFEGTIVKGTIVTGFSFGVRTSRVRGTSAIANIAQVFGATPGVPNQLVYDESGDQLPNNFNDDGTPGPTDASNNPIIDNGIADPATEGSDDNNNNTGTGPGGEPNVIIISTPSTGVLNGPLGVPDAIGPTDNNDDFVNKSTPIPPGLEPTQPVDPPAVSFANTVQNTSSAVTTITLLPTPPANPSDLPNGTQVTISYGNISASYTYSVAGGFTSSQTPVVIPNVPANGRADYAVAIDLPASGQLQGYPVPIAAFIDSNGNRILDAGEPVNNTIDRLYTGFLQMLKESRILKGNGPDVQAGQDSFSTTSKTPAPGNIIEYRFRYSNISSSGGSGNVTLKASNIVITEDGTTYDAASNPSGNSWALDSDNRDADGNLTTGIDTSNVVGSAVDSRGGNLTFFSGRPATVPTSDKSGTTVETDVTRYVNTLRGSLGAGESGTFTFQRRVN